MLRIADEKIQNFEIKHIQKIRDLAPECVVLLKNDNVLPLYETGKIALYGSGARKTQKGGTGSGDVNVRHFVTIEEGLENAGIQITSKSWLDDYEEIMKKTRMKWVQSIKDEAKRLGTNPIMLSMGKVMLEPDYELPLDAEGDTAVYVLSRISGEGSDREATAGDIDLTETEIRDILALNKAFKKFVLVLNVGGMINLEPVAEVQSILLLGQLGTPIGDVCADILLGMKYPSGKLAMTWAPIDRYVSTEGFGDMDDTLYREGIYVGYRYFDSIKEQPAYPFGFGLSYTKFQLESKEFYANEKEVSVTVSVKNVGDSVGKEVVQLYYSAPWGEMNKPYQELASFTKTRELEPGEMQNLTLTFGVASMASYSEERKAYILEGGDYIIRMGNSSRNTEACGIVRLDSDAVTYQVKNVCQGWGHKDFVPEKYKGDFQHNVKIAKIKADAILRHEAVYEEQPQRIPAGRPVDWSEVMAGEKNIEEFIAGLKEEELADLCVGNYIEDSTQTVIGSACTTVAGGAGETTHFLNKLHLNAISMADGPAGIRISKEYKIINEQVKSCDDSIAGMSAEFLDEEQLKLMAQRIPKPTQEEIEASKYYQYCSALPIGTALAQSFNEEVCEICGQIVGKEMELFGISLWLAPALNIQRSPLCGRNFEYYSEDPLISGKIAAAITKGVQCHSRRGTTVKHFVANNQETNRYASNSIVSERALREIYLKGFEICIKESQPEAVMTSYNLVNGEHACSSKELLTYVLRNEWGYKGIVMTDWYVTTEMMRNPVSKYPAASAAGCVKAGNNLTMSGLPSDKKDIMNALKDTSHPYRITIEELQACAKTVLYSILRIGVEIY